MPRRSRQWKLHQERERRWVDPLIEKLAELKLPPPPYAKRIWVRDDRIFGFGLMLTERGKRSFIFECRIGGKSRRLTYRGDDPGEARKWAADLELKLQSGTLTPTAPKQASYDVMTLRRAVHDFLRQRGDRYRSAKDFLARFENHVFPTLGDRPIESLTRSITVPLVEKIALEHRHAAHAVARDLNIVGRWYAKRTDAFVWPAVPSPLTKADRRTKARRLEDWEISSVWRACEGTFGRLVRFLLLTGLRLREAAELRRSEVAADFSRLTLAPARVKTDNEHVLPLSQAAAEILRSCPDGEWFFPGFRDPRKPFTTFGHAKAALDRRTNTGRWKLHFARHTAQTIMEEIGIRPDIIDRCLNHSTGGMAGRYGHHTWEEEKRDALERLATLLKSIVE
jgi:integrase